jgi:pyridinium-3,5-biscarboxylic acid mononucleotide synthase
MDREFILNILNAVKNGQKDIDSAYNDLKNLPYEDIDFAKIDHHRQMRRGLPEVIFCDGKTKEQIEMIIRKMYEKGSNILGTRLSSEKFEHLKKSFPESFFHEPSGVFFLKQKQITESVSSVSILTAGTSDINVAEEAALTLEFFGVKVKRFYDIGVAGIHRLFNCLDEIDESKVIIAVAGMEGALASVVAGLTDKPVIAVPTSVGYGANFGGLSALLTMINSCSGGISVVNINNGFGAAYSAALIIKQIEGKISE